MRGPLQVAVVFLALSASELQAQTIRGTLVEEVSGRAITHGFVVLLDSTGAERDRALTDAFGRYVLTAPAPGRYALRTEVIGLHTWVSPLIELRRGEVRERLLELPTRTIVLSAVVVSGDRTCGARPDEGALAATVWKEARKALFAVRWSEQRRAFRFRMQEFQRELDLGQRAIGKDSVAVIEGYALTPFRSLPAEELAERGYVYENDEGWTFNAPDADVIFSQPFIATHCFKAVEGNADRQGLIGLAFEPVRGRRIPDVKGALWLDRETTELRFLEFGYTRLRFEVSMHHVGGRVEFARLDNGVWIVRRWWITTPKIGIVQMETGWREVLLGYTQDGGEVLGILTAEGLRPLPDWDQSS